MLKKMILKIFTRPVVDLLAYKSAISYYLSTPTFVNFCKRITPQGTTLGTRENPEGGNSFYIDTEYNLSSDQVLTLPRFCAIRCGCPKHFTSINRIRSPVQKR